MFYLQGGLMKHPSRPRKPANLSHSADHHLDLYALAATAAGVGILALAQPAEAKIVYTPAHQAIGKNSSYPLDLNHDGIADFTFVNKYGCNFDYCYGNVSAIPAAGNAVEGAKGLSGFLSAYALNRGSQINSKHPFSGQLLASGNMGTVGKWINVTNRYLGLKFKISGQIHYGWARLNVYVKNGDTVLAQLTGYAYETVPNKPIIAGQTSGPDEDISMGQPEGPLGVPAPKQPELSLLALGSSGLSVRRREETGAL
jgi:hypothetical protein